MYTKIIFIIFVCTLRHLNAHRPSASTGESSIREAIQSINPKLNKLTARLKDLKLELLKASLKNQIQNQKSTLGPIENLLMKIENLDLKVIEIKETKTEENVNVDNCIDSLNEKIEKILTVAHSKTNQNFEKNSLQATNYTQSVNDIINKANDIERNMNKLIGYCIRQNSLSWQKGRLTRCLSNETALLNAVVDKLYDEKEAINSVKNTTARDGLSKWYSKIEEQFNSCISTSMLQKQTKDLPESFTTTMQKYEETETETLTDFPKTSVEEHQIRIMNRVKNIQDLIQQYVELRKTSGKNFNFDPVDNSSSDVVNKKDKFILLISV